MEHVYVQDRVPLDPRRVERTPEGYLRADALISRTGVQRYRLADGREVGVLRHPDDVFEPASLASFGGIPVTVDHPDAQVDARNIGALGVGLTSLDVVGLRQPEDRQEASPGFVRTVVQIMDARGVAAARDRRELSCGYTARWTAESGTWGGEGYEFRQREIRGNHVALVPAGRAGPDVRLYGMDSEAVGLDLPTATEDQQMPEIPDRVSLTRDGATVEIGASALGVVRGWLDAADARIAKVTTDAKQAADAAAKVEGERDSLKSEVKRLGDELAQARAAVPTADAQAKAVADAARARVALLQRAADLTWGSRVTFDDCASAREIQLRVIATRQPDRKVSADAPDAYVDGLFEGLTAPGGTPPSPPPLVTGDAATARAEYLASLRGEKPAPAA